MLISICVTSSIERKEEGLRRTIVMEADVGKVTSVEEETKNTLLIGKG